MQIFSDDAIKDVKVKKNNLNETQINKWMVNTNINQCNIDLIPIQSIYVCTTIGGKNKQQKTFLNLSENNVSVNVCMSYGLTVKKR